MQGYFGHYCSLWCRLSVITGTKTRKHIKEISDDIQYSIAIATSIAVIVYWLSSSLKRSVSFRASCIYTIIPPNNIASSCLKTVIKFPLPI